ncbi:hypothetical protein SAMN05192539_1004213 [Paraburkholderia diazotrophica]|uniref:Uncharacterized protein n=1 Tax=Paraburkholderia diazotrophica TaxID=667676 RepID=A0A1H6TQ42_9BURK|nr:hypothetical protein SAMN05192539_1004213 [Paraburkholderia diazotrophica]
MPDYDAVHDLRAHRPDPTTPDTPETPEPGQPPEPDQPDTVPDPTREPVEPDTPPIGDPPPQPSQTPHTRPRRRAASRRAMNTDAVTAARGASAERVQLPGLTDVSVTKPANFLPANYVHRPRLM